jgi:hypothetical protein
VVENSEKTLIANQVDIERYEGSLRHPSTPQQRRTGIVVSFPSPVPSFVAHFRPPAPTDFFMTFSFKPAFDSGTALSYLVAVTLVLREAGITYFRVRST